MDARFHGLPPLKRLRIIQQEEQKLQQQQQQRRPLPTKKRRETWDSTFLPDPPVSASPTAYSLPAKKRVWALQPESTPTLAVSESLFDLNVEYKPSVEEEIDPVDLEPNNEIPVVVDSANQSIENPQDENEEDKREDIDGDEDDDDGVLCTVCGSSDGDPTDPIVFCDGCDLMVHTTCYGNPLVKGVPEGDWFCSECLASSSSKSEKGDKGFSCCLCPIKEGAMKPTTDGKWAHIVCALLVPEVFFRDPEGREEIDCSQVPNKRWMEKCYICNSLNGCAIVCSESKCSLAFHVTCGLKEDLSIEYKEGKSATIVAGFCKTHTEVWKKQQQSGKYKIVAAS
ncbi:hypothetical protein L6164_018267 [Bauhinia variegata]|uniref:Uncharacterized protein n=1 Tax=Bauhinia variegata TaxID=167791 RepID=A0ACB9NBE6_BAUVA|nr:hypothetical protein L6164_018267 [Bauhinia variegata]